MIDLNRQTGRTTRMLLNALLHASTKDGDQLIVVAANRQSARHIFDRLYQFARVIHGIEVDHSDMRVRLPNRSAIKVMAEPKHEEMLRGVGEVMRDHFADEVKR